MLIEIAEMHCFPKAETASSGLPPSGDQVQQGGFAAAIGSDDADPILGTEAVGEILQKDRAVDLAISGDRQLLSFDRELADPTADAAHLQLAAIGFRGCCPHLLDSLNASFLLGAPRLGALTQPGQFPSHHALEAGSFSGF